VWRFSEDTRTKLQMFFQDPFASLIPRLTVGNALMEVLKVHNPGKSSENLGERMQELMKMVGLRGEMAGRYPHEFSGGQRQRIGVARALAVEPSLIIADEPVSALDVSIQAHILNLLKDLQNKMQLTYLFIAHDLAVVRYMCDRILVMYLGRIVESSPAEDLFSNPSHPYTEVLMSAIPDVEKGLQSRKSGSQRIVPKGDVPSGSERIRGCPFHPRCHKSQEKCVIEAPLEKKVSPGHMSRCHFA
ncbi:oligopeptide ABC transporter ATP-binding protein OppF, partial [bacterium B17]